MDSTLEPWDELDVTPDEPVQAPAWRRRVIVAVAAIAAAALLGTQAWNLIARGAPPVAENGLEICGFDYCTVQEAIRAGGLGREMARLASSYVGEAEARALAAQLTDELGVGSVEVVIVGRLDGLTAGQYSPGTRTISLEAPVRAWIVYHEVAHTVAGGHGDDFVGVLEQLVRSTMGGT